MNKYLEEREKINQLYDSPKYRRVKYAALFFVAIAIILLLSMTFFMDNISSRAISMMRGCAGLCAIIFVTLVGLLSYRVNKEHINNRRKNKC